MLTTVLLQHPSRYDYVAGATCKGPGKFDCYTCPASEHLETADHHEVEQDGSHVRTTIPPASSQLKGPLMAVPLPPTNTVSQISVSSRVGSIEAVHTSFVFYADNCAGANFDMMTPQAGECRNECSDGKFEVISPNFVGQDQDRVCKNCNKACGTECVGTRFNDCITCPRSEDTNTLRRTPKQREAGEGGICVAASSCFDET